MRTHLITLSLCLAAAVAVAGQNREYVTPEKAAGIVITGATLIDVGAGEALKDSVIVIEGERIKQVGKAGAVDIPPSARVIDARGKWIIPGLMDMHSHISGASGLPLNLYLANGVTTIRDPGGNLTLLRLLREHLDSGKTTGPRLFFAGPILDGSPPVWPAGSILADTPDRATSAVNFLIDQGVDFIKVYNNISEPVLKAIIHAAHQRETPVIGHVPRSITMTRAVELGMDCLEHIRITGRELLPLEEANKIDFLPLGRRETLLWQRFDLASAEMKKLVSLLAEKKVFLDPTLTVDENTFAFVNERQAEDPDNRFLPRELADGWARRPAPEIYKIPSELRDAAIAGFKKRQQFVGMLSRAGVQIVAGTDGVGLGTLLPGFGLQHELELLAAAGLKPIDVIRAATITAARALNRERELGSIETGKFADLVILNADPLAEIGNTKKIHLVMKGGQIHDPAALLGNQQRVSTASGTDSNLHPKKVK
ncbi:MAG: amidohydrolase family protein [Blastocatellia bacterium]